jgi:repressor LexA
MKLTKRQKEILDFITEFIDREGYSPSMEEIAGHFRIASLNAVFKHLEALQFRGYLHRDSNRARSIELSQSAPDSARTLPLLGYIAAGQPIEAIQAQESMSIPDELLAGSGSHYILRVKGESMIEDQIADGDYVIVQSRQEALPGEMVIALVDGASATLKRYFPEGGQIRLQPANAKMPPMVMGADRVQVQGIVVAVMRKYR